MRSLNKKKIKEIWKNTPATLYVIHGLIGIVASPLTFVYLIYIDSKIPHSFLTWIGLIICDVVLAWLWSVYWLIELIRYLIEI